MTKAEIIKFYTDHGWTLSTRSPRLIISPSGAARIALNPRHVRSERRHSWMNGWGRTETSWHRKWSSRYADLFITDVGLISSTAFVGK